MLYALIAGGLAVALTAGAAGWFLRGRVRSWCRWCNAPIGTVRAFRAGPADLLLLVVVAARHRLAALLPPARGRTSARRTG